MNEADLNSSVENITQDSQHYYIVAQFNAHHGGCEKN